MIMPAKASFEAEVPRVSVVNGTTLTTLHRSDFPIGKFSRVVREIECCQVNPTAHRRFL